MIGASSGEDLGELSASIDAVLATLISDEGLSAMFSPRSLDSAICGRRQVVTLVFFTSRDMAMFHFRFEVQPSQAHLESREYAGAIASCWVRHELLKAARLIALGRISDEGWTIVRTLHADVISRETQLSEGLKYYEQAEIDGDVIVFFTFRRDAEDSDAIVD